VKICEFSKCLEIQMLSECKRGDEHNRRKGHPKGESNKPKIMIAEYKRWQGECKRAAAHASSVDSVAVER
jgi:hypothetical protein